MAVYLRAPNYLNNLRRFGSAIGDADAVRERVGAHLDAGASHVCIQALRPDLREVPEADWTELAGALELG